jgi:hypothetical protein
VNKLLATATFAIALSLSMSAKAESGNDPCTDCKTHRWYINSEGHRVHSPSETYSGKRPPGATAHCRDGSWSFSEHPSASHTCSYHGGVDAGATTTGRRNAASPAATTSIGRTISRL